MNKLIPDLNAKLVLVSTKSMGFPDHEIKWYIRDQKRLTIANGRIISDILGWRYDKFQRIVKDKFNASEHYHPFNKKRGHVFWYNEEDAQRAFDFIESQRLAQKLTNINNQ